MNILKKAVDIGKSEIFYELDIEEAKLIREAVKMLIPKKKKAWEKLNNKYEGQADIYMKLRDLNQEIKFLENF
jgi:hypothetical protein